MKILNEIKQIRNMVNSFKKESKSIGFVPTMGALHNGHLSLVEKSKEENDITIVSIFVNPLQFGPNEDYDKYPRPIEKDTELLMEKGVDIVFNPDRKNMYEKEPIIKIDMPQLFNILCGKSRQGHFSGVCVVVAKLMNIVQPNKMYMGEKDFQQLTIIKRLVMDLSLETEVIGLPIVRDSDGLALSSRNVYLSDSERKSALAINKSRKLAWKLYQDKKSPKEIEKEIKNSLSDAGLRIDYVEIRESDNLEETKILSDNSRIFIAAYSGKTRLIDNFSISECNIL